MKTKLQVVVADPAGNITVIVTNEIEAGKRAAVANALLEMESLHAQQVGFATAASGKSAGRLTMMGGEFCGNATRSFGYYLSEEMGMKQEEVLVEISGVSEPLLVIADRVNGTAKTQMPHPAKSRTLTFTGLGTFPLIEMEGISHIIVENRSCSRNFTEKILEAAREVIHPEALGILCFNGISLTPAVFVEATNSLVYESSCGSGSIAVAGYLTENEDTGVFKRNFREPGGVIETEIVKQDGKIISCQMGGKISLSDEMTIYV